ATAWAGKRTIFDRSQGNTKSRIHQGLASQASGGEDAHPFRTRQVQPLRVLSLNRQDNLTSDNSLIGRSRCPMAFCSAAISLRRGFLRKELLLNLGGHYFHRSPHPYVAHFPLLVL